VEPHLPELRRRYAACGCGFVTTTLIRRVRCRFASAARSESARREPVAAAVSNYRFFPLKQAGAAAARPLPEWIQANHDPQTKAVLGFNLRPAELPGGKAFSRCTPVAEEAALAKLAGACVCCVGVALLRADVLLRLQRLTWWARRSGCRTGWPRWGGAPDGRRRRSR
jgi:hypothetical protein